MVNYFAFTHHYLLECIHDEHNESKKQYAIYLRLFPLFYLVTSPVTAYNVDVFLRKLKIIPGFHFYITKINFKHQSSVLSILKVELMLLLAILHKLKTCAW